MAGMCQAASDPWQIILADLLADPLIQAVMQADKVQAVEIEQLFANLTYTPEKARADNFGDATVHREEDPAYRSGVGIMLLNDRNEVFVGERLGHPGEWQMPQGGIEPGEAPKAAASRELREEIGTDNARVLVESRGWLRYDLPEELIGKVWGGRWRGQQQKWFAMRILGTEREISIATEHPEFSAWRWLPLSQLPQLVVSFKRRVYEAAIEEFRDLQDRAT